MAFLLETFDMFLSGRKVELAKGHVVVLYRYDDSVPAPRPRLALANVRVNTLEEAKALEAIAVAPAVYGRWEPNYRFEGKALSVGEFGELVQREPAKFAHAKLTGSAESILAAVSPTVREGMMESLAAIGVVKPSSKRRRPA